MGFGVWDLGFRVWGLGFRGYGASTTAQAPPTEYKRYIYIYIYIYKYTYTYTYIYTHIYRHTHTYVQRRAGLGFRACIGRALGQEALACWDPAPAKLQREVDANLDEGRESKNP